MDKINVVIVVVMFSVLILGIGFSINYYQVSSLQGQMSSIQEQLSSMKPGIDSIKIIKATLDNLDKNVTSLKSQVIDIRAQIDLIKSQLEKLQLKMNQLSSSLMVTFSQDDFEQLPTNWVTETGGLGTVTKSSDVKLGGLYSAHLLSPNSESVAGAYLPISRAYKDVHLRLWFYVDYSVIPDHVFLVDLRSSGGVQSRIVVDDDNGSCIVKILRSGSGYDPSSYQNVSTVTRNAWHKCDVYWFSDLKALDVRVDDVDFGYYAPYDSSVIFNRFYLGDSTVGGFSGSLFFDNLLVEGSLVN